MNDDPRPFSSFRALRELEAEFREVADQDSRRSRRPGWKRWIPALAIVAVLPVGWAVADTLDTWPDPDRDAVPVNQIPDSFFEGMSAEERAARTAALTDDPPAGQAESNITIEGAPPAWILDLCRGVVTPPATSLASAPRPLHCQALEAVANGSLAPGSYSDAELRERFERVAR